MIRSISCCVLCAVTLAACGPGSSDGPADGAGGVPSTGGDMGNGGASGGSAASGGQGDSGGTGSAVGVGGESASGGLGGEGGSDSGGSGGAASGGSDTGGTGGVVSAPCTVSAMTTDSASSQVRQGGTIRVTATGTGFGDATSVSVEGITGGVAEVSRTDTTWVFDVTAPHGSARTLRDIELVCPGGNAKKTDVLSVTAITSTTGGSDQSGLGTTASPFRTLTHALQSAGTSDTIQLGDGYFLLGETYANGPTVPNGVTVLGSLQGIGTALSCANGGNTAGLRINGSGTATLKDIFIQDCTYGVHVSGSAVVTATNVNTGANQNSGLYVTESAQLSLASSAGFCGGSSNGSAGLTVAGNASATVGACTFQGNAAYGVLRADNASLTLTGTTVKDNALEQNGNVPNGSCAGVRIAGNETGLVKLTGSTVTGNHCANVYGSAPVTTTISGGTISDGVGSVSREGGGILWDSARPVDTAHKVTLSNVAVHDNYNNGVFVVNGPNFEITAADIKNNGKNLRIASGIYTMATHFLLKVSGGTIGSNTGDGITIADGTDVAVQLSSLLLDSNGYSGLKVSASDSTVIAGSPGSGLSFWNNGPTGDTYQLYDARGADPDQIFTVSASFKTGNAAPQTQAAGPVTGPATNAWPGEDWKIANARTIVFTAQ